MVAFEPAYQKLFQTGALETRVQAARAHLDRCDGCAWKCGVNRHSRKLGICRTGARAMIASYGAHMGEEPPLTGTRGSGTIFFNRCGMHCQFCQNYDISQSTFGVEVTVEEMAAIMLELQERGCHNINLVSPSHVVPQIIAAVYLAAKAGLCIPLVYNTGGYDSLETLQLLDGIVDIYMPDMKYASEDAARKYSKVSHYPQSNQAAVLEMHRQVGNMQLDENGLAARGLLVRHLVLPNRLAGTEEIAHFLAEKVSTGTYFNLMDQYYPVYHARQYPEINRRITLEEYQEAQRLAQKAGLIPAFRAHLAFL